MNLQVSDQAYSYFQSLSEIHRGHATGLLARVLDDQWRHDNRRDLLLKPDEKAKYGLSEWEQLWIVTHYGVSAFFTETNLIEIVSLNRLSAMRP